jgi:hypothetical protein
MKWHNNKTEKLKNWKKKFSLPFTTLCELLNM